MNNANQITVALTTIHLPQLFDWHCSLAVQASPSATMPTAQFPLSQLSDSHAALSAQAAIMAARAEAIH